MGPNGETPSWSLSHDVSFGALGGFAGFHGTVEVLMTGMPLLEALLAVELETSSLEVGPAAGL